MGTPPRLKVKMAIRGTIDPRRERTAETCSQNRKEAALWALEELGVKTD